MSGVWVLVCVTWRGCHVTVHGRGDVALYGITMYEIASFEIASLEVTIYEITFHEIITYDIITYDITPHEITAHDTVTKYTVTNTAEQIASMKATLCVCIHTAQCTVHSAQCTVHNSQPGNARCLCLCVSVHCCVTPSCNGWAAIWMSL